MWIEQHYGAFLVHTRDGSDLVQTDWDYPPTAERFGWSLRRVQRTGGVTRVLKRSPKRGKGCDHRSTDGTIDCAECGATASEFIQAAGNFLADKC